MRNAMCVGSLCAVLVLLCSCWCQCAEVVDVPVAGAAEEPGAEVRAPFSPNWRIGVMWGQPTSDVVQDWLGSAGGLVAEYSFASSPKQDTAVSLSYQRMRTGEDYMEPGYWELEPINSGTREQIDVVVLGLKRRFGSGARLDSDGFFAGIGLGLACSHFHYSETGYEPYEVSYDSYRFKLGCSASLGMNFSRNLYAEATYTNPGSFSSRSFSTLGVTMGARF